MPDVASETLVERLVAEGLISMSSAAKLYGSARAGIATHRATPTRHALKGVRLADGRVVRLEAIRVNGALRTTRAAVLRFLIAQNEPDTIPADTTSPTSRTALSKAQAVADKVLNAAGI